MPAHATAVVLGLLVLFLTGLPVFGEEPAPPSEPPAEWPWAQYGLPPTTNPAALPLKRTDWAYEYHNGMLQQKLSNPSLIFLGDSITMMWRTQSGFEGGTPVWHQYYAPLNAANFGLSGDTTATLLWRLTEGGDLEGLNPRVVVLLIGINNLLGVRGAHTPEQVAEGITTIVNYLKVKLPDTRLLLLGIFPCWESPQHPARELVRQTNALIAPLEDRKQVWYLDLGPRFLEPDGTISKVNLRDLLHLSEVGYQIWASAMHPYLLDLLNNQGQGELWDARGPHLTAP